MVANRKSVRKRSFLLVGLALGILGMGVGCLSFCHPIRPCLEQAEMCRQVPQANRSKVYIFLLNGLDPLHYANLVGVRDYLNEMGFIKTFYGQMCHETWFAEELERVHQECPDAHFVIIGFDHGAESARRLAFLATSSGIPIDLLVYLEPKGCSGMGTEIQEWIGKVLHIQGRMFLRDQEPLEGVESVILPAIGHYSVPTHPATLERLTQELLAIAGNIVVSTAAFEMPEPLVPHPLPPREELLRQDPPSDEWDFLKPRWQTVQYPKVDRSNDGPIKQNKADNNPQNSMVK